MMIRLRRWHGGMRSRNTSIPSIITWKTFEDSSKMRKINAPTSRAPRRLNPTMNSHRVHNLKISPVTSNQNLNPHRRRKHLPNRMNQLNRRRRRNQNLNLRPLQSPRRLNPSRTKRLPQPSVASSLHNTTHHVCNVQPILRLDVCSEP